MSVFRDLVRQVVAGTITPTEVVEAVRAMAPESAKWNPGHAWWRCDGEDILDVLIKASSGKVYLSAHQAVEVARTSGKVVPERLAGLQLFRVLAPERAVEVVVERLVSAALPADWTEPTWAEDELPTLEVVRREVERLYLRRLLTKNAWNISASAREADVARQTLHALLKAHHITRPGSTNQVEEGEKAEAA